MDMEYLNQMRNNAVTGGTSMRPSYEATRAAQLGALESGYNQNLIGLSALESSLPTQYNPLRAQATVNAEQQRRVIQERMANAGLSGIGGTSLSWQQRNNTNMRNEIGGYNLAQQQALQNIGMQRSNLGSQYQSDVLGVNADIDRQIAEYEYNQKQTDIDRYTSMFNAGLITYDQYRTMYKNLTGVDLGVRKRSGGGSGGGSSTLADLFNQFFGNEPTNPLKNNSPAVSTSPFSGNKIVSWE